MSNLNEIGDRIADLAERVTRLEAKQSSSPTPVVHELDERPSVGEVRYSGSGPWQDRAVVWQMERSWDEVVSHDVETLARVFGALASPGRLRIVAALTAGTTGTSELATRVDAATSGQLFHHLKELLAIGIVHQPRRGHYALRPQHVLPILAAVSAAIDLAPPGEPDLR